MAYYNPYFLLGSFSSPILKQPTRVSAEAPAHFVPSASIFFPRLMFIRSKAPPKPRSTCSYAGKRPSEKEGEHEHDWDRWDGISSPPKMQGCHQKITHVSMTIFTYHCYEEQLHSQLAAKVQCRDSYGKNGAWVQGLLSFVCQLHIRQKHVLMVTTPWCKSAMCYVQSLTIVLTKHPKHQFFMRR